MKRRTFLKLGTGALAGSALAACGGGGHDGGTVQPDPPPAPARTRVVVGWNAVGLQAVRSTKPGPPMAARSLAVLHTAIYNAWAAYDAVAMPAGGAPLLRRPAAERTAANKAMAMSYAAHAALVDQFPTQKPAFDSYLATLGFAPAAAAPDSASPQGVAAQSASAMLAACHQDGANQLGDLSAGGVAYADYTGYAALNPPMLVAQPSAAGSIPAPGHWQPLSYVDASGALKTPGFVGACWQQVKPFALASASQFRPGPPAAAGSPEYAQQAQRILDVQTALTERQKVIAEYWADGPSSELPPGHWCLFGHYVSSRDGHDDEQDVKMFFALANAVFDAGIAAWDAKRAYDSERPITAIRYLMSGKTIQGYCSEGSTGGLQTIAGEAWTPYQLATFPTPPFPEHVSGHSTFSAAAAEVLRQFTGSDAFGASYTRPAASLAFEPALPTQPLTLAWSTFSEAAEEAGISRIYGGIHFDKANVDGQALGRQVGAAVFARARACWQGSA
jgi:hypothetical protein